MRKYAHLDWHARRFDERESRGIAQTACVECGRAMWLPKSKADKYKRCGPECIALDRDRRLQARTMLCENCGKTIVKDKESTRFCSQKCNSAAKTEVQIAARLSAAHKALRERRAAGLVTARTGPENKRWMGGRKAARERRRDSGKEAATQRAYAAKHPEKRRAWTKENHARRREGKGGRLPNGTVATIGALQRWRCAICRVDIKPAHHIDHIMPLARGGRHEPRNIQLLCPPCNLKKGASHPADYMRKVGRLI